VPKLEPEFVPRRSIRSLVHPGHKKVVLWDSNVLASPYWRDIFSELEEMKVQVDFNQGLDARLLTDEVAVLLRRLNTPVLRLAYDSSAIRQPLKQAIERLTGLGFPGRRIIATPRDP